MGLKGVFQGAAKTVMRVAGDVKKDVRYLSVVSTIYDTSTGVASAHDRNHFFSVVFETYKQNELDNVHIMPTDVKMLWAQKDTPYLTPKTSDSVFVCEAYGSTEYEVKDIDTDPADALWMLQIRARGKGEQ